MSTPVADLDPRENVYVHLRGERYIIPLVILGLVTIPLLAIPVASTGYDVLRVFVLLQSLVIIAIQLNTISGNVQRAVLSTRSNPPQPVVVRTLRWAYTARVSTSLIFTIAMGVGTVHRLGNPVLDWHTPLLQLCLLLLALAWGFMDRRILWLERRADTPEFMRMIEQISALSTILEEDRRR